MQLTPRYDGPDILRIELALGDVSVPLLRQRRRLADVVAALTDAEWATPSRCEQWSVQDVISHLAGVNQFFALSMASALAGAPTRFLERFDPVTTPAALVDASRSSTPAQILDAYRASVEDLATVVGDLDDESWSVPAESPPGLVPLRAVALHALWDAWIHERDILLPLGGTQTFEEDEVAASVIYIAALGLTFPATRGSARQGLLAVDARDPDVRFVVEAGDTVVVRQRSAEDVPDAQLSGEAVALIEGLSLRTPLAHDLGPEQQWLLGGLAEAFDLVG